MTISLRALLATAILAAATPAAGQVLLLDLSTAVPLAGTFDNPCTPAAESIMLKGTTNLRQRVWLMPSGNLRLQIAESTAMNGSDLAAPLGGGSYAVAAASEHDLEFDPVSLSVAMYKKVAGSFDAFHAVLVMAFDPQNPTLQLGLEAACDSGQP